MQSAAPGVSVIISNYNGWHLLKSIVPTVMNQDYPCLEVIIVDDASTDDSVHRIRQTYGSKIKLVALSENKGFAGANNAAVAQAKYDLVLLLNNDIQLPKKCIKGLVAVIEQDRQLAMVGPKINNLNMDMSHYPHNGTMSVTGVMIQNAFTDPTKIFGLAGCAVMYKRDLLGLPFDEDYKFFHEDVYLAWRARLLGYKISRVPETEVIHLGGASVEVMGEYNRYLMERNRLINYLTLFSPTTRKKTALLLLMSQGLEWWSDLIQGRSSKPIQEARQWIKAHQLTIEKKREKLQAERQVDDAALLKIMSGKVSNSDHLIARLVNFKALLWCRLVGLKTLELVKPK